jgi:hypothetical protein
VIARPLVQQTDNDKKVGSNSYLDPFRGIAIKMLKLDENKPEWDQIKIQIC